MGLPVSVGTQVTGSLVVDAASYLWSQWTPAIGLNQGAETWRIQNLVNTACYWSLCVSTTQSASLIVASGALNGAANQTVNALYGFTAEAHFRDAAGATLYYNFQPSATTTVRVFWVSGSKSEASL